MVIKYILNNHEIEKAIKFYLEQNGFTPVSKTEWNCDKKLLEAVVNVMLGKDDGI
jgi:hypothetical protein